MAHRTSFKNFQEAVADCNKYHNTQFHAQHSNGWPHIEDHARNCETVFIGTTGQCVDWLRAYRRGRYDERKIQEKGTE